TGLMLLLRRFPSLPSVARRTDHAFGLDERLSTALTLAAKPQAERNAVEKALLRDAECAGWRVIPDQIVPARPSRSMILAFAILVVALSANLVLSPSRGAWLATSNQQPSATPALPAPTTQMVALELRALADRVVSDAKRTDNAYLKAIS